MAEARKATPAKAAPAAAEKDAPEVDPKDVDASGKTEEEVRRELAGADPVDVNRLSLPDEAPVPADTTPPAEAYVEDPGKPVTMADVAALNGIGIAPDMSRAGVLTLDEARTAGVFVNEGMRSEIEIHGWTRSPLDGRLIVTEEALQRARDLRDGR